MNKLNDIFFTAAATEGVTYENVLEDAQRYFTENHAATIASEGDTERAAQLLRELIAQYIVKRKYVIEGLSNEELAARLYEDMAGYSFLKKWIYMPLLFQKLSGTKSRFMLTLRKASMLVSVMQS